jgi:hypothetical protein
MGGNLPMSVERQRSTPMTWREFVDAGTALEIQDTQQIWFIDFHADEYPLSVIRHDTRGIALVNGAPGDLEVLTLDVAAPQEVPLVEAPLAIEPVAIPRARR